MRRQCAGLWKHCIWLTDSAFVRYTSLNDGFPKGSDNRKIFDVHRSADGMLMPQHCLAVNVFDGDSRQWRKFDLDVDIERFVAIESIGDTLS
jgi:hypothetical protein